MSRTVIFLLIVSFALITGRIEAQPPSFPRSVEDISRSIESIVRSSSQSNNRPSMALIDRETARSMNYDNQLKHTKTYFENRKLNRSYRQAERGPRQTSQQISRRAKEAAPDRLTVNQYDQAGGRMNWPVVLKADTYTAQRTKLDQQFPLHAREGGGINTSRYANIQTTIQSLQSALRAQGF
jgi:hypothetical protein